MKKLILSCLVLSTLLISACDDSDGTPLCTEFAVSALVTYSGEPSQKFEFENDGVNYTKIHGYYNGGSGPFPDNPSFTFKLEYNTNNELAEVQFIDDDGSIPSKYVFEITSNSLKRTYLRVNESTGNFEESEVHEEFYMKDPEDGYYIFHDHLYEYENGNVVGYGVESQDNSGNLDALEKNWVFYTYLFDNKPNVLTNYALSYAVLDEFFERSRNKNNLIGFQWDPAGGSTRSWTLNIDGSGRLTSFIHEATGRTTTFEY